MGKNFQYDEYEDNTAFVVMEMRAKNRARRIKVVVWAALAVAAFSAFVVVLSPKESDNRAVALVRGLRWSGSEGKEVRKKNPGSPTARIHLSVSGSAPVAVDKRELGNLEHHTFELVPGEHAVDVTAGDKIIRQIMHVQAGEEYKVFFDLSAKTVDVTPIE